MNKKKEYVIPSSRFIPIRSVLLQTVSGEIINNNDNTTQSEVEDNDEEFNGLFD